MESYTANVKKRVRAHVGQIATDGETGTGNRAQEKIYEHITRGLTDVLNEYQLLGDGVSD